MATSIDPNDPAPQPLIPLTLPLAGKKALLVGIANKDSFAYGCARAFGAEVAMTYRREKPRTYTQPSADALQVPPELFLPCEVREPDHLARIRHEPPAATADLAVLPGVLGSRTD